VSPASFRYADALAWIGSHPPDFSPEFQRHAALLGDRAIPAMVQVLAEGSTLQIVAAMLVLSINGVTVTGSGDSTATFEYQITTPDGATTTVRPNNLQEANYMEDEPGLPQST
jgi:hypothetical protein